MSDINPTNIIGANSVVVGYVGGVDYPPYDKQGTRGYKQVSVPINEGYKKDGEFVKTGVTWYRYELHEDKVAELGVAKGDKVRIDNAKQETREYGAEGDKKIGITLKFGELTILEKGDTPAESGGDYF